MTSPTRDWGPALVRHRQFITYQKRFVVDLNEDSTDQVNTFPSTSPYGINSTKVRSHSLIGRLNLFVCFPANYIISIDYCQCVLLIEIRYSA